MLVTYYAVISLLLTIGSVPNSAIKGSRSIHAVSNLLFTAIQTSFDATAICKCKLFDREIYRTFWRIDLYLQFSFKRLQLDQLWFHRRPDKNWCEVGQIALFTKEKQWKLHSVLANLSAQGSLPESYLVFQLKLLDQRIRFLLEAIPNRTRLLGRFYLVGVRSSKTRVGFWWHRAFLVANNYCSFV